MTRDRTVTPGSEMARVLAGDDVAALEEAKTEPQPELDVDVLAAALIGHVAKGDELEVARAIAQRYAELVAT